MANYIVSSGEVSSGIILENKTMTILDGGKATDTTLNSRGWLYVSSGGTANSTTVNSGGIAGAFSGGMANSTTVNVGGRMIISSGGTALEIIENGGYVDVYKGANVSFVSNAFSGLTMKDTSATIHSGTTATDIMLDSSILYAVGGSVNNAVFQYGKLYVSGCTVNNIIAAGFDIIHVSSGGVLNNTTADARGSTQSMCVFSGGTANNTVMSGGVIHVSSGGVLNSTTLDISVVRGETGQVVWAYNGKIVVSSGGTAQNTLINGVLEMETSLSGGIMELLISGVADNVSVCSGGVFHISGGNANSITIDQGGQLRVFGGKATNVIENGGCVDGVTSRITFASNSFSGLVLSSSWRVSATTVHSGTTATATTINSYGRMVLYSSGIANFTTVNSTGYLGITSGGTANSATVDSFGSMNVFSGGTATGQMAFSEEAVVSAYEGAILNFDLTQVEAGANALVNNLSIIHGTPIYTLTVSDKQADGVYLLAEGAADFNSTITVQNTSGNELGTLTVGETLSVGDADYTLNLTDDALTVTVELQDLTPTNLVGTADGLSWNGTGADAYVVELSTGDPGNVLAWTTRSTAQDLYDLPGGMYQWRVKADGNSDWAVGNEIVSEEMGDTPQFIKSNGDGNTDVFFANAVGTWESGYLAQHVGSINDWSGTNEYATIFGKNKLADIIEGSTDANILLMTDDENGDALFVDDIYSALPGSVKEQQARIAQIDEIRAGFGDDIVDMTSQRFEYIGVGLTIRGGAGNDVIWANKGDNFLFGDAGNDRIVGASGNDVIAGGIGNDRMHGGGGDDIFTFCENWGTDTVEQLAGGSVTLWFASGSEANWNAETLTYMDGTNSVKVSGVAADKITLKFGDDGSDPFATLSSIGAFFDATTERIFEESGKGILARL